MSVSTRKQAVVLLSGGLDSMVCAGLARESQYARSASVKQRSRKAE